jgi:hypothetical protein
VKKCANCSKRELTLRMEDACRNEKWTKECCCPAADIKGTSAIVDLSAKSVFYDKPKEMLTTMTLFTATARAPVMTIQIEVMAGDIKVDPPSSQWSTFLMPLAVTGLPPSRDRPVHSIAAHQEENSHTW